jgi:hypothetical protein
MDVNYFGQLRCCKAFLPILKDQAVCGKHKGTCILNMTSIAGLIPGIPILWNYMAGGAEEWFPDPIPFFKMTHFRQLIGILRMIPIYGGNFLHEPKHHPCRYRSSGGQDTGA